MIIFFYTSQIGNGVLKLADIYFLFIFSLVFYYIFKAISENNNKFFIYAVIFFLNFFNNKTTRINFYNYIVVLYFFI